MTKTRTKGKLKIEQLKLNKYYFSFCGTTVADIVRRDATYMM